MILHVLLYVLLQRSCLQIAITARPKQLKWAPENKILRAVREKLLPLVESNIARAVVGLALAANVICLCLQVSFSFLAMNLTIAQHICYHPVEYFAFALTLLGFTKLSSGLTRQQRVTSGALQSYKLRLDKNVPFSTVIVSQPT